MSKSRVLGLIVLMVLVVLSGCSKAPESSGGDSSEQTEPTKQPTVPEPSISRIEAPHDATPKQPIP